jgi:hypothetical protein
MSERKYISEFGLNMFGAGCVLLQQDRLNKLEGTPFGAGSPCHIYLIGRRPRVVIMPESVQFKDGLVIGEFIIQRGAISEKHGFSTANIFGTEKLKFECPYPHSEFKIADAAGNGLMWGKVALLVAMLDSNFWALLDFEVLYVGQSYGDEGNRSAPDRLQSHSTLQKIYAEAIRLSPDKEIWISLWSFETLLLSSFDGMAKTYGTTDEQDTQHLEKVLNTQITEQQKINFTEAALIRYFQPEYNILFKDTFPNPAHKTYAECYDIDLNLVSVELQTETLKCRFWSPKITPAWVHFATFPLHSPEERRSMFDVSRKN